MKKFYIEEITQNHAIISVKRNDEMYFYHLTLDDDYERIKGDDYQYEYSYKAYHAIIENVQWLDDDENLLDLPPHEIAYVADMIDGDYFHGEYASLFDDEYKQGKYVGYAYY